nr:hypothetical protein [Tanacetum cinerariifolium]
MTRSKTAFSMSMIKCWSLIPDLRFSRDYPPMVEDFLCRILSWFSRSSYPLIDSSLGKSISVIYIAYSLIVSPLCSKF